MNKEQFLATLNEALSPLSRSEREDILSDYIEHFRAGQENGKTPEEVAQALGDPSELARAYIEELAGGKGSGSNAAAPGKPAPDSGGPSSQAPQEPPLRSYAPAGAAQSAPASREKPQGSQALGIVLVVLFNFFLGAWILIALACAVIALWAVPISLFGGGLAVMVGAIVSFSGILPLIFSLLGISLIALSGLAGIGMYYVSYYFIRFIAIYIKFCAKLCREGI